MDPSPRHSQSNKKKIEKLQVTINAKKTKKHRQQKTLPKLISGGIEESDSFVDKAIGGTVPMQEEEYGRFVSLITDWRVETKWEDIYKTLYGAHISILKTKK